MSDFKKSRRNNGTEEGEDGGEGGGGGGWIRSPSEVGVIVVVVVVVVVVVANAEPAAGGNGAGETSNWHVWLENAGAKKTTVPVGAFVGMGGVGKFVSGTKRTLTPEEASTVTPPVHECGKRGARACWHDMVVVHPVDSAFWFLRTGLTNGTRTLPTLPHLKVHLA